MHIFDRRLNIGRVFLDDGRESAVIQFPETYEENDRIFIVFPDNDPEKPPTDFHVRNEEACYGQIIIDQRDNMKIMRNWPRTGGVPLRVNEREVAAGVTLERQSVVSFHVQKDRSGYETAVEISLAPDNKAHLGERPAIGYLRRGSGNAGWSSGVVVNVIQREDYYFGFIKPYNGGENVWFPGHAYTKNYGKDAARGDIVYYKVTTDPKTGKPAVRFRPASFDDNPWLINYQYREYGKVKTKTAVCPQKSFSNFQEPTEGRIYMAYVRHNSPGSECTVEVKLNSKAEAISVLNNRDISGEMKLEAIDYLIPMDLMFPETAQADKLLSQKAEILYELADREFSAGRVKDALEAEARAQSIKYHPERLARYASLRQPWGEADRFTETDNLPREHNRLPWSIIEEISELPVLSSSPVFSQGYDEISNEPAYKPELPWNYGNWEETTKEPSFPDDPVQFRDWREND